MGGRDEVWVRRGGGSEPSALHRGSKGKQWEGIEGETGEWGGGEGRNYKINKGNR